MTLDIEAASFIARAQSHASGVVRTETISSYRAFLDLEPAWRLALQAAEVDHPFLEHCWIKTWWDAFGGRDKLHIVVVRERDEILAIAPLIRTTITMFGMRVRRIGFFYNSHVPRAGFIIVRRPEAACRAILDHLLAERGTWDVLQLCQLPLGSPTLATMRELSRQAGLPYGLWLSGASPYIPLTAGWSRYCDNLATKHRSNLRNRFKRLNLLGEVALETVKEATPQALQEGLQLEEAAWKGVAGTAISGDPQVRAFYENFARRAAEKQWLQLNFLRAGGQRLAFDYSLDYNNQTFLLKLGYDPAVSALSPSNLLLSMTLERAFERGQTEYDFLGEQADWKSCWARDSRPNYWLYIFASSFKGRWLHFVKFRVIPNLRCLAVDARTAVAWSRKVAKI